jgi:hypothetical protein
MVGQPLQVGSLSKSFGLSPAVSVLLVKCQRRLTSYQTELPFWAWAFIRPLLSLERLSFMEPEGKVGYRHGQGAGDQETMDYLEFIARVTSHIPDKGQVTVRYYGLYANAHRGKVKKASLEAFPLRIVEEEPRRIPSKGWAEMILKVYEVDPMVCPKCGETMKVVAFLTEHAVVDRIIDHLKLTFVAERPPPPQAAFQEYLWAADPPAEYFP